MDANALSNAVTLKTLLLSLPVLALLFAVIAAVKSIKRRREQQWELTVTAYRERQEQRWRNHIRNITARRP